MATLTETLSNGLKSLFSGLGAKTSNTTNGGVPLLNTSTGEPNGMMVMSVLQSALMTEKTTIQLSGVDSITKDGIYRVDGTSAQPKTTDWGIIIHLEYNTIYAYQIKLCANSSSVIIRRRTGSGWEGWKNVSMTNV